jgi:hypothetical protein
METFEMLYWSLELMPDSMHEPQTNSVLKKLLCGREIRYLRKVLLIAIPIIAA